jgi:hypothetical protein
VNLGNAWELCQPGCMASKVHNATEPYKHPLIVFLLSVSVLSSVSAFLICPPLDVQLWLGRYLFGKSSGLKGARCCHHPTCMS